MFYGLYYALLYYFWDYPIDPEPSASFCFFPCFSVSQKRNIKRSPTGMKPSEKLNLERKQYGRLGVHVRKVTREARGRGRAHPPGCALNPRGPLVAPLTYFFLLYIPIYPKTFGEQNRSGVPPPQASVATKNQSGPCSGTLPEGGSLTGGHLHHPCALHDEEGVVHPRG